LGLIRNKIISYLGLHPFYGLCKGLKPKQKYLDIFWLIAREMELFVEFV